MDAKVDTLKSLKKVDIFIKYTFRQRFMLNE